MKLADHLQRIVIAALLSALSPAVAAAFPVGGEKVAAHAPRTELRRVLVHGRSLEGNLSGESADRETYVILPPSYASHPRRRYPVVYVLHGYAYDPDRWVHGDAIAESAQIAFDKGAREMILVFPNARNAFDGSMYSNSVTTGNFEDFIAYDLPHYIDSHYRTLADRASRGLAGHSMGGYGAARIGMKHPDMFGALYIMSPCCMSPRDAGPIDPANQARLAAIRAPAEVSALPFMLKAQLAVAAAWSPNPANPPLYLDLPVKGGAVSPEVLAKWAANAPLAFVDQYIGNLKQYRAIGIDVGDQDGLKTDTVKLHDILDSYHVANSFELYAGDHANRVRTRIPDVVIPFFSRSLAFPTVKRGK
jgi:S-formylglutathione hydrolase FrmB